MRKITSVTLGWIGLTGLIAYGVVHGASAMKREFSLKRAISKVMGSESGPAETPAPVAPARHCGGTGEPVCEAEIAGPCEDGRDCAGLSGAASKPLSVSHPVQGYAAPTGPGPVLNAPIVPPNKRTASAAVGQKQTSPVVKPVSEAPRVVAGSPFVQPVAPCRTEPRAAANWQGLPHCGQQQQRPIPPDPAEVAALQAQLNRLSNQLSAERGFFERQSRLVGPVGLDSAIEAAFQEASGLLDISRREMRQGNLALASDHLAEAAGLINNLRNRH